MSSLTANLKVGTTHSVLRTQRTRQLCCKVSCTAQPQQSATQVISRRNALSWTAVALSTVLADARPAHAIQGESAGRVPGVSKETDDAGLFTYTRPAGKSGGHGVGWSEIPRYSFKVPKGWEEMPTSIADLGGTEIDLRFLSKEMGQLSVVVAPVLRFKDDIGFNARVTIESIGPPDRIIAGFAPELFGAPLDESDVLATRVMQTSSGNSYYLWDVKPHRLVSATAVGSRVFILVASSNPRQWKKFESEMRVVRDSFNVPEKKPERVLA